MTPQEASTSHIAWNPDPAARLLLAGDETAATDLAIILATLPTTSRGQVFIEVAHDSEVGFLEAPSRFTVTWLVRANGQSLRKSLDAWLSEMLPTCGMDEYHVYAWIANEGPARLLSSE